MILYKIAKRLEEWMLLQSSIQELKGDPAFLLYKKQQVENEMMDFAHKVLALESPNYDAPLFNQTESEAELDTEIHSQLPATPVEDQVKELVGSI